MWRCWETYCHGYARMPSKLLTGLLHFPLLFIMVLKVALKVWRHIHFHIVNTGHVWMTSPAALQVNVTEEIQFCKDLVFGKCHPRGRKKSVNSRISWCVKYFAIIHFRSRCIEKYPAIELRNVLKERFRLHESQCFVVLRRLQNLDFGLWTLAEDFVRSFAHFFPLGQIYYITWLNCYYNYQWCRHNEAIWSFCIVSVYHSPRLQAAFNEISFACRLSNINSHWTMLKLLDVCATKMKCVDVEF